MNVAFRFGTKLAILGAINTFPRVKLQIEVSLCLTYDKMFGNKFLKLCFQPGQAFGHSPGTTQSLLPPPLTHLLKTLSSEFMRENLCNIQKFQEQVKFDRPVVVDSDTQRTVCVDYKITTSSPGRFSLAWLFIGGKMLDKLSTFLTLFAGRNMELIVQQSEIANQADCLNH